MDLEEHVQCIHDARCRIAPYVNRTPVMSSRMLNDVVGGHVFLKCEQFQRAGSFKIRGACNTIRLLTEDERARGVITHSSGNHAQALALAARELNTKAVVVMPQNSPTVKIAATRGYGAHIILCPPTLEGRETYTKLEIEKCGYTLVHSYNDIRMVHGQGTAALELLEDTSPLDIVFAAVGGGGLLSGTALATKGTSPTTRVVGVEPTAANDAWQSLREGHIVPSNNPTTIADGLKTSLGSVTFPLLRHYADEIILVTEHEILEAMRMIFERLKLVVEPSGAVPLAGVIKWAKEHGSLQGKRVGAILCGGNVDLASFFHVYEKKLCGEQ